MANNVILYDTEIQNAAAAINNYCDTLAGLIDSYVTNLKFITENAIEDQQIANKLIELGSSVESLKTPLAEIAKSAHSSIYSYVTDVDNADQFLY